MEVNLQNSKTNGNRNEFINKEGRYPKFRTACRKIGIAPQTAKRPAPTLAEKWNNVGYRQ